MAVSLDVGCQDLATPLDVGCPDGLSMKVNVASEKPLSTPSEHQLRCLLFFRALTIPWTVVNIPNDIDYVR